MLYVRGSKYDYDQWEALGNRGWNYANLLPFFLKSEKNFGPSIEGINLEKLCILVYI